MTHVFLGKILLRWCMNCNLPVLSKKCGTCEGNTTKVPISPPGDARPAFPYDLSMIREAVERGFGDHDLLPDDRVVVLNSATSYEDRLDEIVMDGQVIGAIRYELDKWIFMPRLEGARRMSLRRGWVRIDEGAVGPVAKNSSVLGPGVIDADPDIQVGDEVIVLAPDDRVVAVGRARKTGEEMLRRERGMAVKPRWSGLGEPLVLEGGQTWDDVIKANLPEIEVREREAMGFIRNTIERIKRPVSVSFSGGKDSLATLYLVMGVTDDFDVLYADTGLEFPETTENVHRIVDSLGLRLRMRSAGDSFWEYLPGFGPPSVESRWCCKVAKLGPITRLIEEEYEECLTFIGQRRYESEARSHSPRVWRNPWVANQVSASPIQQWTAMHVWLYLFWKGAEYNPLYEQGYERIGCYLCPSSDLAELHRVRETHPELWARWEDYLRKYMWDTGLDEGWIDLGLWRWRNIPQAMRELAEARGVDVSFRPKDRPLRFSLVSGYRPCIDGNMTAEASFGGSINLLRVEESGVLNLLGRVRGTDGLLAVYAGEASAQVYASGAVTVRAPTKDHAEELAWAVERAVRRALGCAGCGVCLGRCPVGAVTVDEFVRVSQECTRCGKCEERCPVLRF